MCKSCRYRQELSREYLLAKIGVDTAENEPLKVCQKILITSSQMLRKQVRTNIGNLLSGARDRDVEGGDGREPRPDQVDRADQPAHGRRHGHGAEEPEGKTNMKYH